MKILFICSGNTCRSPMAEAVTRAVLKRDGIEAEVSSRGLFAHDGEPASDYAKLAMKNYGLSLDEHTAKTISREDIASADIVLTMTGSIKQVLSAVCPAEKLFTFKEYSLGEDGDISDPFGGSPSVYMECAEEILKCAEALAKKLGAKTDK